MNVFKIHENELKIILRIIFIFFLIFVYINLYYKKNNFMTENNNLKYSALLEEELVKNLPIKTFEEFRRINLENKLIEENIKFQKQINPIITIIVTVYNQAHCLHACLRSIQNQSLKNIEIIVIDDCSLDDSYKIIKEFQKEDSRIIIIEHDSNEGTIKSRTDGIRIAKGNYITIIDADDSFIHKDILKNSLYFAEKDNLDVVEFQIGEYENERLVRLLKIYPELNLTNIIYQPELKTKFIIPDKNYSADFPNRAIYAKLITKELFKKVLDDIGTEYTDDYINYAEDTLMVVSLLHLANSYYLMKEIGYFYTRNSKRESIQKNLNKICKPNNKIKDFSFFKFLKFLVGRVENNEKEQIMAYKEIVTYDGYDFYFNEYKMGKEQYNIIFYIFNKSLEFEFLNVEQKNEILKLKKIFIKKLMAT